MRQKHQKAFTLVELLVVIGIIALLLAILLPTLARARAQAQRVQCASNQRQLVVAIINYGQINRGALPLAIPGVNPQLTWMVYKPVDTAYTFKAPDNVRTVVYPRGWYSLGKIFEARTVTDPKAFYCPAMQVEILTYPAAFNNIGKLQPSWNGWKGIGYQYRLFYDDHPQNVTIQMSMEVNALRLGKMKNKALITDIIALYPVWTGKVRTPWPHDRKPIGVNVAYSDGHADWVELTKEDYESSYYPLLIADPYKIDHYTYQFFKALDNKDFTQWRKFYRDPSAPLP